jgi:hypothetical protein
MLGLGEVVWKFVCARWYMYVDRMIWIYFRRDATSSTQYLVVFHRESSKFFHTRLPDSSYDSKY